MVGNFKEKKEKEFLRLQRINDKLYDLSIKTRNFKKLKKPIHIGWEIVVSSKIENIQKVLNELKKYHRSYVCGQISLRSLKYYSEYDDINELLTVSKILKKSYTTLCNLRSLEVSPYGFESFPKILKDVFQKVYYKNTTLYSTNKKDFYYKLYEGFPFNSLEINVRKIKATHQRIPNSEIQSELDKLDTLLHSSKWWKYTRKNRKHSIWEKNKDLIKNKQARLKYRQIFSKNITMLNWEEMEEYHLTSRHRFKLKL